MSRTGGVVERLMDKLFPPPARAVARNLEYWREMILGAFYLLGVTLGVILCLFTVPMLVNQGLWPLAILDVSVAVWGLAVAWFGRRISYRVRALGALAAVYVVGILVLYMLGPYSGGLIWLFSFSVIAGALLGVRASVSGVLLNVATFVVFAWLIKKGEIPWAAGVDMALNRWVVLSLNFLVLNTLISLGVAVLARGLTAAYTSEKSARTSLEEERLRLEMTNSLLITEMDRRREVEEELRETAARFHSAFSHASVGMALLSPEGVFLAANAFMCQLLGCPEGDLVGSGIGDFADPETHEEDSRLWDDLLSGVIEEITLESRFILPSGGEIWGLISASVVRDERGKPLYLVCHLQDVTQRRRAQVALAHSEERYRSLVENVPYGMFIAELPSGRLLFVNRNLCLLFGYTQEEALRKTIWDASHPSEHAEGQARLQARLEGKPVSDTHTYTGIRKDGSLFRYESSMSMVTYQGKPALQGVIRDVTEKEALADQLLQAQKMQAVGTLAAGVAHEFNNILMVIQGYVDLITRKREGDQELLGYLAKLRDGSERAARLTHNLLGFARREGGDKTAVRVDDLLDSVLGLLSQTLPPGITVELDLEKGLPLVKANAHQMEQVLLNLAVNARDAMPCGGTITLFSRQVEADQAFLAAHPWSREGLWVALGVSDTGQGMDEAIRRRVFEPFFTTKEPGRGTGLGLSLVYSIVSDHEGAVVVDSEPGRGSSFKVYLPAELNGLAEEAPKTAIPDLPWGQGQKILVVDDEEAIREVTGQVLVGLGYRVEEAGEGGEALEKHRRARAEGRPYDLVVLDLAMPGMDGRRFLEHLSKEDPEARVILATGLMPDSPDGSPLPGQVAAMLLKPFDMPSLANAVDRALAGKNEDAPGPGDKLA